MFDQILDEAKREIQKGQNAIMAELNTIKQQQAEILKLLREKGS